MNEIIIKWLFILIVSFAFSQAKAQFNTVLRGDFIIKKECEQLPVNTKPEFEMVIRRDSATSIKDKEEATQKFCFPLANIQKTSVFGLRIHPVLYSVKMHAGLDLKAYYEPVYAIADGIIEKAYFDAASGNYIIIKHSDNFSSVYAHLSEVLVDVGQKVKAGDVIGISGNSGRSTGPHLHFGIKFKGRVVDPEWFLMMVVP